MDAGIQGCGKANDALKFKKAVIQPGHRMDEHAWPLVPGSQYHLL
jgi:hypothetical protein